MGISGKIICDEDKYCAEFIYNSLNCINIDFDIIVKELKNIKGKMFFDPKNKKWAPEKDFYLCTSLNKFNFVLEVIKEGIGDYFIKKVVI
jgi:2-phosphosulfolactate phosphatase